MKVFSLTKIATIMAVSVLTLSACNDRADVRTAKNVYSDSVNAQAAEIAKNVLIIDTHIDVPYRLDHKYEDVSQSTASGDFDYPRAVQGGLNAPFMSIYIPAKLQKEGGSKALADKLIDDVEKLIKQSPKKFAMAHNTKQVEENFANGIMSLPMGMENGSPIEGDLANLKHFYDRGIRYITLTHSKTNHISDSSYDENKPAQGLTDFGKELVVEMNNIGVMVDISHVSDQAFYQVMEISKTPVIASHSSARFFTPGFERNMNDDMIKLLAKNGGVIQMTFSSVFTSKKYRDQSAAYDHIQAQFIKDNKLDEENDKELIGAYEDGYWETNPYDLGSVELVVDHFEHVINMVGIDHVGIGSDFDGVGKTLPPLLKDVSTYPNLIAELLKRGYSEADIEKLLSGNLMRVWKEVEVYAEEHKLSAEALALVKKFGGTLKPLLKTAMKSGGPVNAINVCSVQAPAIAKSLSENSPWTVKRVSLKARNQKTATPDAWEKGVLEDFETQRTAGVAIKNMTAMNTKTHEFRYMKAQGIAPVCLNCHGTDIKPEVQAALNSHYKNDKAVGYKLGDVRGAFSLTKQL